MIIIKLRLLTLAYMIALWVILAAGCAVAPRQAASPSPYTNGVSADGVPLDSAIKEAAARIDERIEAGTKIALLNFNSPSEQFSLYVLDELTANLLDSRKLTVVDRKELYLIRDEFALQLSGDVADTSMQELGRMLGAQSIVSGSLTEIGGSYRIVIRVLNVQSAAIAAQYRTDIANDKRVSALLASRNITGTPTASSSQPSGSGTQTIIVRSYQTPPRHFDSRDKRRGERSGGIAAAPSGLSGSTPTASNRGGTLAKSGGRSSETPTASNRGRTATAASQPHSSSPRGSVASAPTAAGASILFMTMPTKADVYVGGKFVGTSNNGELQVPVGTHKVRFVKGEIDRTFTFTFTPGKNEAKFVPLKQER